MYYVVTNVINTNPCLQLAGSSRSPRTAIGLLCSQQLNVPITTSVNESNPLSFTVITEMSHFDG